MPSIQFSSAAYIQDESQTADIAITRTGNLTGVSTVTFSTANGTATGGAACAANSGIDYVTVTGQTVTFNANEMQKIVNVAICGDGLRESQETVLLSLAGSNLGTPSAATLTINDTATTFRNATGIVINGNAASNPYPSQIMVAGGPSIIGSMRVTLYDLGTAIPDNVDVLLVGPGGQKFILMANSGGNSNLAGPVTLNFTDTAGQVLPDSTTLTTGTFEPTSWGAVQDFPAPAPTGFNLPGSTIGGTGTQTLGGNYNGTNANGTWSLYVRDDTAGGFVPEAVVGNFAGGWGIEFVAPTAANAAISGRVTTADGTGIRNATVTVTGNSLTAPRTVTTSSFGYYTIDGLQAGETYVVTVGSQRFTFQSPSRVISLVDNVNDADFTADN